MFKEFAGHYDRIYSYKDTTKEVRFILAAMKKYGAKGKDILDVACGTGRHAELLAAKGYNVIGIDKNEKMLQIARRKVRAAKFLPRDMRTFRIPRRFDAILCMFTSLSYNTTRSDMVRTLRNFRRHLKDKGIIIFDVPFKKRKGWTRVEGDVIDENAAVLYSWRELGQLTIGDLYWIVRNPGKGSQSKGASVVLDRHVLRFYRLPEMKQIIATAGLRSSTHWDFSISAKKGRRPAFICWQA